MREIDPKTGNAELTFSDFQFDLDLQDGLDAMGFKTPTPIQQQAIPKILAGKDLIACAQTGTGKTAAYLLPIIHKIISGPQSPLNTLILAPTRELAQQIDQQIEGLTYFVSLSSISIYGGGDGATWDKQKKALETGAEIIVATPGRLIALITNRGIDFTGLKHLVLDEADRMLDMGFHADIMRIIHYLPEESRQTLLFSATMPPKIKTLASKILKNPDEVSIAIAKPAEGIRQLAYVLYENQKEPLVKQILRNPEYQSVIVFANKKEQVKRLGTLLQKAGFSAEAFSSDLEQKVREEILLKFSNRQIRILVGTDILSRGIDVEGIDLVINFDSPGDPEDYVHRIGRTARAESKGTAITFISPMDQRKFATIEELIEKEVEKLPLPKEFEEGPEYNPRAQPRTPMGGRGGPSRGGGRSGGSGGSSQSGGNNRSSSGGSGGGGNSGRSGGGGGGRSGGGNSGGGKRGSYGGGN